MDSGGFLLPSPSPLPDHTKNSQVSPLPPDRVPFPPPGRRSPPFASEGEFWHAGRGVRELARLCWGTGSRGLARGSGRATGRATCAPGRGRVPEQHFCSSPTQPVQRLCIRTGTQLLGLFCKHRLKRGEWRFLPRSGLHSSVSGQCFPNRASLLSHSSQRCSRTPRPRLRSHPHICGPKRDCLGQRSKEPLSQPRAFTQSSQRQRGGAGGSLEPNHHRKDTGHSQALTSPQGLTWTRPSHRKGQAQKDGAGAAWEASVGLTSAVPEQEKLPLSVTSILFSLLSWQGHA